MGLSVFPSVESTVQMIITCTKCFYLIQKNKGKEISRFWARAGKYLPCRSLIILRLCTHPHLSLLCFSFKSRFFLGISLFLPIQQLTSTLAGPSILLDVRSDPFFGHVKLFISRHNSKRKKQILIADTALSTSISFLLRKTHNKKSSSFQFLVERIYNFNSTPGKKLLL